MGVVVVGGQARNIGKTSVMAELIAALPELHWTAIKITQCDHDSVGGKACDCELGGQTMAFSEERERGKGNSKRTDSARYLAAGATRSFWLRIRRGHLSEALPQLQQWIDAAENSILESTSVLEFLRPDVALFVVDPSIADFKASGARLCDRVDAVICPERAEWKAEWKQAQLLSAGATANAMRCLAARPRFFSSPPIYASADLLAFVASRLAEAAAR